MNYLKVAILEDNPEQLKDRKQNLEELRMVNVVAWATNSTEYLEKVNATKPEALIIDIDLGGDSMNGLEIAYKLKLPVLFVSGHNAKNLKEIETLKREFNLTVDHLTKPFSDEDFKKTVIRFVDEVNAVNRTKYIYLDFGEYKQNKISIDNIVFLCTDKNKGAKSGNKEIYFTDRKPEILIDFSFVQMESIGFDKKKFITIHKSFVVNAGKKLRYLKNEHKIEVEALNSSGKMELFQLPVSDNYKYCLKK